MKFLAAAFVFVVGVALATAIYQKTQQADIKYYRGHGRFAKAERSLEFTPWGDKYHRYSLPEAGHFLSYSPLANEAISGYNCFMI